MVCPPPSNSPDNPCADDYGLAWQVTESLEPGEVLELTSSIDDPYLAGLPHTVWPGFFNKNGTQSLWVYVDSWNGVGVTEGFIIESKETNNRIGPVDIKVTGTGITTFTGINPNDTSPPRPLPQK